MFVRSRLLRLVRGRVAACAGATRSTATPTRALTSRAAAVGPVWRSRLLPLGLASSAAMATAATAFAESQPKTPGPSALDADVTKGQTAQPLRILLFGATGRTGVHYLPLALARGHTVTVYVRNAASEPLRAAARAYPHTCRIVAGALDDTGAVERAVRDARPDVVVSCLASDPAPHTAMSDATRSLIAALRSINQPTTSAAATAATDELHPHFITISGWGAPATQPYMPWLDRTLLRMMLVLFGAAARDFDRQLTLLDGPGVPGGDPMHPLPPHKQTFVLPPLLTNAAPKGPGGYVSGDVARGVRSTRLFHTIARADMAEATLRLTELAGGQRAGAGPADPPVPRYFTLHNK